MIASVAPLESVASPSPTDLLFASLCCAGTHSCMRCLAWQVSILGLTSFAPGKALTLRVHRSAAEGGDLDIPVQHSFNDNQIRWFKAGSALNAIKQQTGL
jgi:hypothetical protein